MRTAVFVALALVTVATGARAADDVDVKELKSLSAERCLQLPPVEIATRCPLIAGRFLDVDAKHYALLDRLDQHRSSFWCDQDGANWRCRRVVVIDRELRGARKRNSQAFVTTTELLRTLATAPSVKIGDELGALNPPGERQKSCLEIQTRGCATQAVRFRGRSSGPTPSVRRRMWLVEDADGPLLQCSDATFSRCDELNAAGWLAIAVMLRPSSLSSPHPAPEFDLPEIRSDKRPGLPVAVGGAEAADTPAGSLDPFLAPRRALPAKPSKSDSARATKALQLASRSCMTTAADAKATVDLVLSGEGRVLALAAALAGAAAPPPITACLTAAARKVDFPRFSGDAFRLRVVVSRK